MRVSGVIQSILARVHVDTNFLDHHICIRGIGSGLGVPIPPNRIAFLGGSWGAMVSIGSVADGRVFAARRFRFASHNRAFSLRMGPLAHSPYYVVGQVENEDWWLQI